MKSIFVLLFSLLITIVAAAQPGDTLEIKRGDLNMHALQLGKYSYILYYQKAKASPAQNIILVKIDAEAGQYHGKSVIIIKQEWDRDTVVHAAYSIFNADDFSTIVHDSYWKHMGYSMKFDFEAKTAVFTDRGIKGGIPDSIKTIATNDFNQSFQSYNLNWHADLIVYQLLPYKANRTFIINYYDPGLAKTQKVAYTVTGSEFLTDTHGQKVECWVLNHNDPGDIYERFWISKKTNEVLKEEDSSPRGLRYKVKIGVGRA
jgi:hypothetical protein